MWRRVDKADLQELAEAWMKELRAEPAPSETPAADAVVLMNFTAPAEKQWAFVLCAIDAAKTENERGAIAAGPFEHLLGSHGPAYIDAVEARALSDPKFARMTTYAWQYKMSDVVWQRVRAIQARAK